MEDAGIHHTNIVCEVVAGLQEVLQQEKVTIEHLTVVESPIDYVDNAVKKTQQQLATQLQQIQAMIQATQM